MWVWSHPRGQLAQLAVGVARVALGVGAQSGERGAAALRQRALEQRARRRRRLQSARLLRRLLLLQPRHGLPRAIVLRYYDSARWEQRLGSCCYQSELTERFIPLKWESKPQPPH